MRRFRFFTHQYPQVLLLLVASCIASTGCFENKSSPKSNRSTAASGRDSDMGRVDQSLPSLPAVRQLEDLVDQTEKTASSARELSALLSQIRDERSAEEALTQMNSMTRTFVADTETMTSLWQAVSRNKMIESLMQDSVLSSQIETLQQRLQVANDELKRTERQLSQESSRVASLEPLTIDFWNAYRLMDLRLTCVRFRAGVSIGAAVGRNVSFPPIAKFSEEKLKLCEKHGPSTVIDITISGARTNQITEAKEKLAEVLGKDVVVISVARPASKGGGGLLAIAPVPKFNDVVNAIDFGEIDRIEEPRRRIIVKAHPAQTPTTAGRPPGEPKGSVPSSGPATDPDDPEFFRANYELMTRRGSFGGFGDPSVEAMKRLKSCDPKRCQDANLRKQIARTFKDAAFDENPLGEGRNDAIEGMAIWGGKYSVPLLIELLEKGQDFHSPLSDSRSTIVSLLGKLGDPRAVDPLAQLLSSMEPFGVNNQMIVTALVAIGPECEEAMIDLAPHPNPDACIAAIQVLGKVGTKKSLPILRKAKRSSNATVRHEADIAMKAINTRQASHSPES